MQSLLPLALGPPPATTCPASPCSHRRLPHCPPLLPPTSPQQDAARKALQDAFKGKKDPFAAAEERAKKRGGGGGGGGGGELLPFPA